MRNFSRGTHTEFNKWCIIFYENKLVGIRLYFNIFSIRYFSEGLLITYIALNEIFADLLVIRINSSGLITETL